MTFIYYTIITINLKLKKVVFFVGGEEVSRRNGFGRLCDFCEYSTGLYSELH